MDEEGAQPSTGPWGPSIGPFGHYHEVLADDARQRLKLIASQMIVDIKEGKFIDWPAVASELTLKGIKEGTPIWNMVLDAWNKREA
jgi:hypothetical protein